MAKSLGSSAVLSVSTDGNSYTTVGKVKSITLPVAVNLVDATDNDDAGIKTMLPGDKSLKLSVTCTYDPSDSGQAIIFPTAVGAKTLLYFRYRSRGTGSGLPQMILQVYLDSAAVDSKHEAIQELTFAGSSTSNSTDTAQ